MSSQRQTKVRYFPAIFNTITTLFTLLLLLQTISGCSRVENNQPEPDVITTETGVEMVVIPAGWFIMGDDKGAADEKPAHQVWVDSFLMDKYEVTQDEFRKHQISDPSHFKNMKNPLEQMNWTDAVMYCNDRSYAEGLEECYDEETWDCNFLANGYRLPTEAEWEYTCRAGTATQYSFGDSERNLAEYAWFSANSEEQTHLVGQKQPNRWGLYDMHGNVSEWCNDWYQEDYYSISPQKNPTGPATGDERVIRGGAWNSSAESCRAAYRSSDPSINDTCLSSDAIGFRCVRNNPAGSGQTVSATPLAVTISAQTYTTGFVFNDIYLQHKTTTGHPEQPERLKAIIENLQEKGLYSRLLPVTVIPEKTMLWLTMVHSTKYIEHAGSVCKEGQVYLDSPDTPISALSYDAALTAVAGVLSAIDSVMEGTVQNAFCAVRPPGHHAEKDEAMGFCIFNNIAVGARYLQGKYKLHRILIVDWDVHHGNGTQHAFYDDPEILYFSVHRDNFYPGTGSKEEKGTGKGLNYTINVPLSTGSTDAEYLKVFNETLKPSAMSFKPEFVLISAGFDAHKDDPLGGMNITEDGFSRMTAVVKEIAQNCCQGRLVSVLEGGYNLKALADSVEAHIRVLME